MRKLRLVTVVCQFNYVVEDEDGNLEPLQLGEDGMGIPSAVVTGKDWPAFATSERYADMVAGLQASLNEDEPDS